MMNFVFLILVTCAYQARVEGRSMRLPDFVSQWFYIESVRGKDLVEVYHNLGEVPALVNVQAKTTTEPNNGYIFPGIGIKPRDDDSSDPYSAIVYIYNEEKVAISALTEYNHYKGRTIYTDNSSFWEGPNSDSCYFAYVRVRAWKNASMPRPDFHVNNIVIEATNRTDCFYEERHGLSEYPSMVVARTKLNNSKSPYHGFWSDAVGSALMVYDNFEYTHNGYVIYGFDTEMFRIWTDSSDNGYVFYGNDGAHFEGGASFRSGQLEIMAWTASSLTPTLVDTLQLGLLPGQEFDNDKHIHVSCATEDLIVNLWAEANDGPNLKFRFPGSGSLSYSSEETATPCSYGGLTYAYSNTSVRVWKPGLSTPGSIICIADIFGKGTNAQSSNNASAKVYFWIPQVSALNLNCSEDSECFDAHSQCINRKCSCSDGYHEFEGLCEKDLTCEDVVPIIPDLERRARNYIADTQNAMDQFVDDNVLKSSWYTVNSGQNKQYRIPDSLTKPGEDGCGTEQQFYINGTHPPIESLAVAPIELSACFDECREKVSIMVRRCPNGDLQYQLGPLNVTKGAYCVDPQEIFGVTEFDPAPEVGLAALNASVKLDFDVQSSEVDTDILTYLPYITFSCEAMDNLAENTSIHTLFYTTYWYIGQQLFLALGPSTKIEPLTEQMLLDRKQGLDIYLSCGIRISSSENGLMSKLQTSADVFYGMKVDNSVIRLKKGENAFITIEPTAPVGCQYSSGWNLPTCSHTFYLVHENGDNCGLDGIVNVNHIRRCGGAIHAIMLNETWTPGESFQLQLTTEDRDYADEVQFAVTLELQNQWHKIWRGHRIRNIMVQVTNSDDFKYKQCYSHIDPHMQTADGNYENQYEGEFVLYRNVKYGIEVQEKTTSCNHGRAFCACAVAIRAGGDTFLINLCGVLRFIGFTSCNDGGILDVQKRNALRYQVHTPIGTYVNIHMDPNRDYHGMLNIDIFMAAKDLENTEGLCGYFDNTVGNDLKKRNGQIIPTTNDKRNYHADFSEEWRINASERNYLVLEPDNPPSWEEDRRDFFCFCNTSLDEKDDSIREPLAICSPSLFAHCQRSQRSVTKLLCTFLHDRAKRSSDNMYIRMESERRQSLVNEERTTRIKRTTNVSITEDEARDICNRTIGAQPAVKEFSHRLKSIDTYQVVEECTYDVHVGNDPSWADVYPSVLNQVIEAYNEQEPYYVTEHKDEVEKFNTLSCPFNCSGNGHCSEEGDCECFGQYHGPDCSIDEREELIIDDLEGDGLCDLQYGLECRCFHFQTSNLLEQFQCTVTEIRVMWDGSEVIYDTYVTGGLYHDIFNGECCIPVRAKREVEEVGEVFVKELRISLSNDGLHFGAVSKITVFDSLCQTLSDNDTVTLKENTCFIGGQCRFENEINPTDSCFICNSTSAVQKWTYDCETQEPVDHGSAQHLYLIIGLCAGIFLAVVTITGFVFIIKKKKKSSLSDANVNDTDASQLQTTEFGAVLH